jgi:radical SAM protein with 4Fe4S-binding SPASM domain
MMDRKGLYQKWFYVGSHARILLRHMTLRRASNLLINQCEYLLRRQRLISYPGFLKIDPSNRCQLRCKGCGQASSDFRKSLPAKAFLTLDDFKRIVDPMASTILGISLANLGEPLLNKEIASIIEHAKKRNIGTTIATNFSLPLKDEFLTRLVKSGLDKLMVSLDGITSDTYEQYRVAGNCELVKSNVQRLASIKRQLGAKTPEIVWKFIVFDHNRHEASRVPILYKDFGFDSYRIDVDRDAQSVVNDRKSAYAKRQSCFFLYSTMVVDADGTANPCCSFWETDWQLGNVLESDIRLLWNSEPYRALRRGFGRKNYGSSMHPVCRVCFGGEPKLVNIANNGPTVVAAIPAAWDRPSVSVPHKENI